VEIQINNSKPVVATLGRLLLASLFLLSGFGKIADPAGTMGYISSVGLPFPHLTYAIALAVEIAGGLALVVGFQTRAVALVVAVYSVVAAVAFHRNFADLNQMVHFLKNIAIAGGLLQVIAFGAGALSIDARRSSSAK